MGDLTKLPNHLDPKSWVCVAIIETPRGRPTRFDYEPDSKLFKGSYGCASPRRLPHRSPHYWHHRGGAKAEGKNRSQQSPLQRCRSFLRSRESGHDRRSEQDLAVAGGGVLRFLQPAARESL